MTDGHRKRFIRAAALGCLIGAATAASAQVPLVGNQEMQELWVGKTLSVSFPNGTSGQLQFKPDNSIHLSGTLNDSGTWRWHEPSGYCATWKTIRKGQERCFTVKRNGNDYVVMNPDGSVSGTVVGIK